MLCGFNGFGQLNCFLDTNNQETNERTKSLIKVSKGCDRIVDFSWAGTLSLSDGYAKLCGFYNGKKNQEVIISPPTGEKIIQGSRSDKRCLIVTETGACWEFSLSSRKWNLLKFAEAKEDEKAVSCCTRTMNLILTNHGRVFSAPTLLNLNRIKISEIRCGFEHSLLLSDRGILYSWGCGSRGQLGLSDIENREEPEEVATLSGLGVVKIAAGGWHSCAITSSGGLYAWGWNNQGQLACPTVSESNEGVGVLTEPTLVEWTDENATVTYVACGSSHTVVLLSDGTVWGCGWNRWNQLGLEEKEFSSKMVLLHDSKGQSVKEITAGHWNTFLRIE